VTAKRAVDIAIAAVALLIAAPAILAAGLLVWIGDGGPIFFVGPRVGRGNRDFGMVKLRSMTVDAPNRGGTSVARGDPRVTRIGAILRRSKLDELPQLWNVLRGEMSLVGPRPNTRSGGVDRYTDAELQLLTVPPGVTDLASIVFSDEAAILATTDEADHRYDRLIRPWKSRLGLLYVERHTLATDLTILLLTLVAIVAKPVALRGVAVLLKHWGADPELRAVCRRDEPPRDGIPPGMRA
jgi:lipopolysaccharide/colanic/teichoic acid biosynthesis glycosyltransferase